MRSHSGLSFPTLALLAPVLCCGCFPMNVTRSPGVTGVVVDAASGAPVAGAEVLVSKATSSSPSEALAAARRPTVTTGADGRFAVPPEKRWIMVGLGAERIPPSGTVVVRRSGYATALRGVSGRSSDVGSIELAPSP